MLGFAFEYGNYKGGSRILLPVNPEEFEETTKVNSSTTDIIGQGQIVIPGKKQLRTFKINSFFPSNNLYPFIMTRNKFRGPEFYKKFFNQIMSDEKPLSMIVTDLDLVVNVTVSKFTYKAIAGTDDISYSLELIEYKNYNLKTYELEEDKSVTTQEPQREASEPCVGSKVVVNGQLFRDSLGGGPGKILNNYNGIISIIKKGAAKPYHIIDAKGNWLGWVSEASINNTGEISDVKMKVGSGSVSSTTSTSNAEKNPYGVATKISVKDLKVGTKITLNNGQTFTITDPNPKPQYITSPSKYGDSSKLASTYLGGTGGRNEETKSSKTASSYLM